MTDAEAFGRSGSRRGQRLSRSHSAVKTGELRLKRGTGGRPSQEQAARRDERLIEIAAEMFLERGFETTTIDAVAERANVGKATLYARYKDKAELFAAVFQRQIDRWLAFSLPEARFEGSIETVLLSLGKRMLAAALAPEAVAVNRILMAQAGRFPALAQLAHKEGWERGASLICSVLQRFADDGQIAADDLSIKADLFLSLVIGRWTRLAMLGIEIDPEQMQQRLQSAVTLFLHGLRPPR